MYGRKQANLKYFAVIMALCTRIASGQMVNPSIDDPHEPFSYYSKPTDVIGVMDGRWGTEVTPEGYLYTGYGELMFFTGNPPDPVNHRVKTLLDGYIPVISYAFQKDGVEYEITAFAATLDGNPESPLINFVRVKLKDVTKQGRAAFFGVGVRFQGESNTGDGTADHRFVRPIKMKFLGGPEQAGVPFDPDWIYSFSKNAFFRSDSLMYMFPVNPSPEKMMTLNIRYNRPQDLTARTLQVLPTTPVGIVNYEVLLRPGEERTLEFKMPYTPIRSGDPMLVQLDTARFDDYLQKTVDFWQDFLSKGLRISVPESKVVNTFKANLIYDLIARTKEDGFYIQRVNDFQYRKFYLRDASFIIRMYLLSGYFNTARECLRFYPRWQEPDGNFVSQGGQFDGWGQTMWAYGQYFRFTRDTAFAEEVYPSILKAFQWLVKAREADPLHLMPVTRPGDNEDIAGHITGHNFWALDGLKNMVVIAEGLGRHADEAKFQHEYDDLYRTLLGRLDTLTSGTGGYIPPGLDGANPPGQDWGNMLTLYPELLFSPFDRMVTATLDSTRAKYREGIMTYGNGAYLHDYLTMRNTQDELVRNEQETALKEFYAVLVHTGSTHGGFEYAIHPWGTREFDGNLAPHGWYAAEIRTLIRNMMVREQDGDLHLFSCISPDWIREGQEISVAHAPTYFGEVNMVFKFEKKEASLILNDRFTDNPRHLVLHLPWFMQVKSVTANGRSLKADGDEVYLPVPASKVVIKWKRMPDTPAMSYENAVRQYEKEYREKYDRFLRTGR